MSDLRHQPRLHFLAGDAESLVRARDQAGRLHATGDIKAAGNHVEEEARRIFSSRLSPRYRVTHGHVADYRGFVSPQFDLIVVDAFTGPPLYRAADGTEYVLFESVYAVGEIKSTYYGYRKPVEGAVETIRSVREGLFRPQTRRNPLFYFMLFVDSGDLDLPSLAGDVYKTTPLENLPNIVCWLDKGTLVFSKVARNGLGERMPTTYLLAPSQDIEAGKEHAWALVAWGDDTHRKEANLSAEISLLAQFMESCVLTPPNLQRHVILLDAHGFILLDE